MGLAPPRTGRQPRNLLPNSKQNISCCTQHEDICKNSIKITSDGSNRAVSADPHTQIKEYVHNQMKILCNIRWCNEEDDDSNYSDNDKCANCDSSYSKRDNDDNKNGSNSKDSDRYQEYWQRTWTSDTAALSYQSL